jgi:hypothetical protein
MRALLLIVAGISLTQLSGCGFVYDKKLTGKYHLSAVDIPEQMSVCYALGEEGSCVGRIDETVFSVGWNERFIVAKQHPSNDKSVTNYFILDMTKDGELVDPGVSVTGPLSESEFKKQSQSMTLPDFTQTNDELK